MKCVSSCLRQHDVSGLQVPVHDPRTMRLVESVGDLNRVLERFFERQCASRQPLRQAFALEIFHDENVDFVLGVELEEGADVWVVQRRNGLGLALEPLTSLGTFGQMLGEDFDRDDAVEAGVTRFVDFPMPATPMGERIS